MPDKILIDAVIYQVISTDKPIILNGQECDAQITHSAAEILVSGCLDKLGEGRKAKALMHEVVHAILHERGLYKASGDEELVDELAKGFVNLIRQNPRLVDFIKGEI